MHTKRSLLSTQPFAHRLYTIYKKHCHLQAEPFIITIFFRTIYKRYTNFTDLLHDWVPRTIKYKTPIYKLRKLNVVLRQLVIKSEPTALDKPGLRYQVIFNKLLSHSMGYFKIEGQSESFIQTIYNIKKDLFQWKQSTWEKIFKKKKSVNLFVYLQTEYTGVSTGLRTWMKIN